ncbi:MAG: transposase [Gammaproteobacteria bacterium]
MARIARVVVPGTPHHVTQRGNRRQTTFFGAADYRKYLELVAVGCRKAETRVWAYCLMPNHVHLVMVPSTEDGLRVALGDAHRRYAQRVNGRFGWRGHLWQERFYSFPMDEAHLRATVRYVERNPVAAKLTQTAAEWPWSSARAHLAGRDDQLVEAGPMLQLVADWSSYLAEIPAAETLDTIARHTRTGRPLGSKDFVERLERRLGRPLAPQRRGRKRQKIA